MGGGGHFRQEGILEANYHTYDINEKKIKLENKYDLIIFNSVLEHLSDPLQILRQFDFKYLYVEVPHGEIPLILSLTKLRTLSQYLIDIYKIVKYRSFYHMHEHINYFNLQSIEKLLSRINCETLYLDKKSRLIKILAKRKPTSV